MSIEPDQGQATGRGSIPVDSFGNRLMLARAHAGHISIREAADLCGIGRGAWTNWEKGARPVDIIEVAAVVADKLGVDREWLLFGGPLGTMEPRSLRRRGTSLRTNLPKIPLVLSAHRDPPINRHGRHVAIGGSPLGPQRRDSTRPQSAIPAHRRRPTPTGPGVRPIPA